MLLKIYELLFPKKRCKVIFFPYKRKMQSVDFRTE